MACAAGRLASRVFDIENASKRPREVDDWKHFELYGKGTFGCGRYRTHHVRKTLLSPNRTKLREGELRNDV